MDPSELLDRVTATARTRAKDRVAKLRANHPGEDRKALAQRLVRRQAWKSGAIGGATASLSLVSLPLGLPAGIAGTLLVEAELLLALLELYDLDADGEAGRVRLLSLWAGAGFADAAKSVGLVAGTTALAAAIAGSVPGQLLRRLPPALVKAVLGRLGLSWTTRVARFWPLLGAPIGFTADFAAARALGTLAIATLESHAAGADSHLDAPAA